jgi:hypothetical protein
MKYLKQRAAEVTLLAEQHVDSPNDYAEAVLRETRDILESPCASCWNLGLKQGNVEVATRPLRGSKVRSSLGSGLRTF